MKTELAWMAGIWEGEGCVRISSRQRKRIYWLLTQITNTQKDMLLPFKKKYGGNLRIHKNSPWKTQYWWTITTQKASKFLEDISPFVVTKIRRDQIRVALAFQKQKISVGGAVFRWNKKEAEIYHKKQVVFYQKMRELHH